MAFKENSVEIPPMNRNINILGMHYVNPHFSGVLDKINESKEQALKVTGEVFLCAVPLKVLVQGSQLRGMEFLWYTRRKPPGYCMAWADQDQDSQG